MAWYEAVGLVAMLTYLGLLLNQIIAQLKEIRALVALLPDGKDTVEILEEIRLLSGGKQRPKSAI